MLATCSPLYALSVSGRYKTFLRLPWNPFTAFTRAIPRFFLFWRPGRLIPAKLPYRSPLMSMFTAWQASLSTQSTASFHAPVSTGGIFTLNLFIEAHCFNQSFWCHRDWRGSEWGLNLIARPVVCNPLLSVHYFQSTNPRLLLKVRNAFLT